MKSTKKSLIASALSLVLCISMLLGTTYAWFTDSVTSGKNKINAGNLDIDLEYTTDGTNWNQVTESTKLFNDEALWEPGYTEVAYLKLSNKGTLALKYQLAINIANEVAGTNVAGDSFKLSDYIKMGVVENWDETVYADRAAARAAVSEAGNIATYTKQGDMLADADALTFAIVAYMPEDVGNEANYKTGTTAPSIEMGVNVVATQLTSESDSFDNQYDKAAWIVANADHTAKDATELKNALTEGGTVAVTEDITGNLKLENLGEGAEIALAGTTVTGIVTAKDDVTIGGTGTITNDSNGGTMNSAPLEIMGGSTVTVDGVSIVSGKNRAVNVENDSKVVVNSGEIKRTVAATSNGSNQLIMGNDNADIAISGGDFDNTAAGCRNASIIKLDDVAGKVVIDGGNFKAGNREGYAKIIDMESDVVGDVTINAGNFELIGDFSAVVYGGKANTTVNINGGTFKIGSNACLVESSTAQVTINDGVFSNDISAATGNPARSYLFKCSGDSIVTVKGGTFTLDKNAGTVRISSIGQNANVILMGGTFNVKPSDSATIANGYKEVDNGNGTWTVVAE